MFNLFEKKFKPTHMIIASAEKRTYTLAELIGEVQTNAALRDFFHQESELFEVRLKSGQHRFVAKDRLIPYEIKK